MNTKRNLLIVSLVVVMMLTAVGYASFSDTLTVNGSVGTASFNVQFSSVDTSGNAGNGMISASIVNQANGGGVNDKLVISLTNAKPGETYHAIVKVANVGASPAQFDLAAYQALPLNPTTCSVVVTPSTLNPIPVSGEATYTIVLTMLNQDATEGFAGGTETFNFDIVYNQA